MNKKIILRLGRSKVFISKYIKIYLFLFSIFLANDLVILPRGKFANTVSELMMEALRIEVDWCRRENHRVNSDKTILVHFTKKRDLTGLKVPILFGKRPAFAEEGKYLGIYTNRQVLWIAYIHCVCVPEKLPVYKCPVFNFLGEG